MSQVITGNPANVSNALSRSITGAVSGTGGAIRLTTSVAHLFSTFDTVTVASVGGTTEANGTWVITVIDSTHFELNGSTFVHAYTSGGTAVDTSLTPAMFVPDDGEAGNVASILASIDTLADRTQFNNQKASAAATDATFARNRIGLVRNGIYAGGLSSFIDTAGSNDDPTFGNVVTWTDAAFNPANDFTLRTLSHTTLNANNIKILDVFISGTMQCLQSADGNFRLKARSNYGAGGGTLDVPNNILQMFSHNSADTVFNYVEIPFVFRFIISAFGGPFTNDLTIILSGEVGTAGATLRIKGSYNCIINQYADNT